VRWIAPPRRRVGRPGESAQGLVEFALVFPIAVFLCFALVDFGRFVYVWSSLSSASSEGARLISLEPQLTNDCYPLLRMEQVGQGFSLRADPNSLDPDNNPNSSGPSGYNPTTASSIPPGTGDIYIYPAVASADPNEPSQGTYDAASGSWSGNCAGAPRGGVSQTCAEGSPGSSGCSASFQVSVQITYKFVPWTPFINNLVKSITITTISSGMTEYS
jgi:hypothetical protein